MHLLHFSVNLWNGILDCFFFFFKVIPKENIMLENSLNRFSRWDNVVFPDIYFLESEIYELKLSFLSYSICFVFQCGLYSYYFFFFFFFNVFFYVCQMISKRSCSCEGWDFVRTALLFLEPDIGFSLVFTSLLDKDFSLLKLDVTQDKK